MGGHLHISNSFISPYFRRGIYANDYEVINQMIVFYVMNASSSPLRRRLGKPFEYGGTVNFF